MTGNTSTQIAFTFRSESKIVYDDTKLHMMLFVLEYFKNLYNHHLCSKILYFFPNISFYSMIKYGGKENQTECLKYCYFFN